MPFLKDGSFRLDDSSCAPYGTVDVQNKKESRKNSGTKNTPKSDKNKRKKK